MLQSLRQLYAKRSPTFLAQICPFTFSLVLFLFFSNNQQSFYECSLQKTINILELCIILLSGTQLVLKSIGLLIINSLKRQLTTTFYTILFIVYNLFHIGVWIYTLILYLSDQFKNGCWEYQPHYFFIKSYVWIYGSIILGGIAVFCILGVPAVLLTINSFRNRQSQKNVSQI